MKIYAIGDLHLSRAQPKPMSIFGENWSNHWEKIKQDWYNRVNESDIVLIPGDISWAMTMKDAMLDICEIGELPGRKIIIRGNHDYWWSSISKIRESIPDSIAAIQNDSIIIENIAFCGTRGWMAPGPRDYTDHDLKIFNREVMRLKLSLKTLKNTDNIIVLLHYPPFDEKGNGSEMIRAMKGYNVKHVIFGHLHGPTFKGVIEGVRDSIKYHLVSCDYLDFKLKLIQETGVNNII